MKGETPYACSDADEAPPLGTFSKDLTRVPGWVMGKKGDPEKAANTMKHHFPELFHFFIFQIKFKQPMGSATL